MTVQVIPPILTVGELKKYLSIYQDNLPCTVQLPSGEFVGIIDASTTVLNPGTVLAFGMTTIKATTGKKVQPVIVDKQ